MSDDLIKLYSGRILALAADMPATDPIDAPMATGKVRAPLCGSVVSVSLDVDDAGRIARYAQDVKACALGQAAASVTGRALPGCDAAQVAAARDELAAMLTADGPPPRAPFDGLAVLQPARDYRNRHASILLSLDATLDALRSLDAVRLTPG
ncbi:iron-sulfur cluster assembly scaffold protein [Jannaschia sp. LMIT008]|uniref:iron-sulfur cluster assembly scaffold protein n=1 Tax=Jannaschia maritima TaxID=3032585 RepID=UPI0028118AFC|nr:iron-sulfur cluster assembly scaffold protein [Jannaschia sp. LMIT008]